MKNLYIPALIVAGSLTLTGCFGGSSEPSRIQDRGETYEQRVLRESREEEKTHRLRYHSPKGSAADTISAIQLSCGMTSRDENSIRVNSHYAECYNRQVRKLSVRR